MKKWILFLIAISCIIGQIYSQKRDSKRISYDIFYEQNISFRILTLGNGSETQEQWYEERKNTERPILTPKIGLSFIYILSNKWSIKSSISFAQYGRIDTPSSLTVLNKEDYERGILNWEVFPNVNETKFERRINYVEIPLMLRYNLSKKTFFYFLDFGVIPSKYINQKTKSITSLGNSTNKYHLGQVKDINIGVALQLGLIALSKRDFNIILSPSFSIYTFRLEQKDIHPINEYLYSTGIRLHLNFN